MKIKIAVSKGETLQGLQALGTEEFFSMADQALLTKALGRVQNRFLLTNLLAMRISQLRRGSEPLIETDDTDYETIALKEIAEGKLEWGLAAGAAASSDVGTLLEEDEGG